MKNLTRIFVLACVTVLAACEHGVEINGQGVVLAGNNDERGCSPEASPCRFMVSEAYQQTYGAVPDVANIFTGWENCPTNSSSFCSFDVSVDKVKENYGKKMASLIANFEPVAADTFDGAWQGVEARGLGKYERDAVCLSRQSGEILCYIGDTQRSWLSLQVSRSDGSIFTGYGGDVSNFSDGRGAVLNPVSVTGGSFTAQQTMKLRLDIGDETAELDLVFEAFHNVGLPLVNLEGEYRVRSGTSTEVAIYLDDAGAYSLVDEADPGCSETGSLTKDAPFRNGYSVQFSRTGCRVANNDYSGFGVIVRIEDKLQFLMIIRRDGYTVSERDVSSRRFTLANLGDD